jgi:hypothetical protein
MTRSTARGMRLREHRPAEAVDAVCASCGRPFGYLVPTSLSAGKAEAVEWHGSEAAAPVLPARPGEAPPPKVVQDMVDHRRRRGRCVRRCGAAPVYTQATLRARYQAARAARQATVRL